MERSPEGLSHVRDGQEELGVEGKDPVAVCWDLGKGQELAAPQTGVIKGEMGLAKMVAAAKGPHSHESFRKKSELRNKHKFLEEKINKRNHNMEKSESGPACCRSLGNSGYKLGL